MVSNTLPLESAGRQVVVDVGERRPIEGREIVDQRQGGIARRTELEDAGAVIDGVPGTIARREINVAARIGGETAAAHPDAIPGAVGGGVVDTFEGEGRRSIGHGPAMPRGVIGMTG